MRVISDESPGDFQTASRAFSEADRLWTNPLITAADARASGRMPLEPDALWLRVVSGHSDAGADSLAGNGNGEQTVGLAMVTPPRGALLSKMPDEAAVTLADYLADVRPDLPTLNGPTGPATACAERFADHTGRTADLALDQRMLATSTIEIPLGVSGARRAATPDDEALILGWLAAFTREALPNEPPAPAPAIRHRLTGPPVMWIWEDADHEVSFCWQSVPAAGVVRVSLVYTVPEFRGRGYAAANVAEVSQQALDSGAKTVMLYTDATNPISNRVYERIGYRYIGNAAEFRFR